MADIFFSYSRQDLALAEPIIAALEAEGWSVWWDRNIPTGEEFDARTLRELNEARAAVVLWTPRSVISRWVKGEARAAADRSILAPVRLESADLPLDVRAIQTTDMDDWKGDPASGPFRALCRALQTKLGTPATIPLKHADAASLVSVCVLPFVNMSGDPEQEYFSDGITEDIITDLSKVSALAVAARNTAFAFKGKSLNAREIAARARVSHILEGSVRKSGQRVRITAQLIDGASGNHLWAERYDRDLSDIFALQDEISQAIVGALKLKLLPEEKRAIETRGTKNPEAYKYYLMARQFHLKVAERYRPLVIRLAKRAAEIDPNYAEAWALLAIGQANFRLLNSSTSDPGWEAANKAIALNDRLAEAHAAKGRILGDQGHFEEAVAEHEIALDLDPDSYDVNSAAARCAGAMRRYHEAIAHLEKAAALVESDFWAAGMLVSYYDALGDTDGAKRAARLSLDRAEKAIAAEPDLSVAIGFGAYALAVLGENDRAIEWSEWALVLNPDDLSARYNIACAMIRAGAIDRAFELLQQVADNGQMEAVIWMESDSDLDPVRDDPRFTALVERAKARLSKAPGAAG